MSCGEVDAIDSSAATAAALAGCELCIKNHEASLVQLGAGEDACHDAVRIAAVMSAVAAGLG